MILLFLMSLLISSCSIKEDPRVMASTQISLTYDGDRCQPYESFVPMGEEIEITLINTSDYDFTWYLIFYPIEGKFEDQDPNNILASTSAKARENSTTTFILSTGLFLLTAVTSTLSIKRLRGSRKNLY